MKIGLHISNFTWPGGPARIPVDLAPMESFADVASNRPIELLGREVDPVVADL
jgi:hypothetical protein